ncbi:MAG: sigma-70 family RNA polymerase sigma factor, partial [Selenomonadaceae bacterium]|nr:sigma-70 family RNA polymerase sigma factor [Selenomonadaceae bacterium]
MADIEYYNDLAQRATTDESAFEELYEYFFPRVYNFIYARLKNSADADDVTSITFVKMNENLESYNPAVA